MRFARPFRVVTTGFVIGFATLSVFVVRAQPSAHYWKPALWIAKSGADDTVMKVSSETGDILLEVSSVDVARLAIDENRSAVWALSPGAPTSTLRRFSFDGLLLSSIDLGLDSAAALPDLVSDPDCVEPTTLEAEEACAPHRDLAVDTKTGWAWSVIDRVLLRTSPGGSTFVVESLPLASNRSFRAVAVDGSRERVYSLHGGRVRQHDEWGNFLLDIPIPTGEIAKDVSVDVGSGDFWVAYSGVLKRYSIGGAEQVSVAIPGLQRVSADGLGACYAATGSTVLHVDANGNIDWEGAPFLPLSQVVDLVADPNDASVWAGARAAVAQLRSDGSSGHSFGAGEVLYLEGLASFADITPPTMTIVVPLPDQLLNTRFPEILVDVSDVPSGHDASSLVVNGLGASPGCVWNGSFTSVTCIPGGSGLADGAHTVELSIHDNAGNIAFASRTFRIDATPPVITFTAPLDGTATNQVAHTLSGFVNEALDPPSELRFERTGSLAESVPVADLLFSKSFTLEGDDGIKTLTLRGRDLASNVGQASIVVTLDRVAPDPADSSKLTVSAPDGQGQVTVGGQPGAVEAGATVTVCNIASTECVSVTAGPDGSFTAVLPGHSGDRFDVHVTDPASNRSEATTSGSAPGDFVPPDPFAAAPPLDTTVASSFRSDYGFLFEGANRLQAGHRLALFTPEVTGIVRGRVTDTAGTGIGGVQVEVVGRQEYGRTATLHGGDSFWPSRAVRSSPFSFRRPASSPRIGMSSCRGGVSRSRTS